MERSQIDGIGLVWRNLDGRGLWNWNWNWNRTLTGTGLVSRIDVIGLFVDPERELMFPSRIDVIGLVADGSGTFSAWLEPEPSLLDRNQDLDSLAGLRLLGWNLERNW